MLKDKGTDSESDWFDKDEDELVKEVKFKLNAREKVSATGTPANEEHISTLAAEDQSDGRVAAAISASRVQKGGSKKLFTAELRQVAFMTPVDAFLFVSTQRTDFLGQIAAHDSLDSVLIYLRIAATICALQMPGFHLELLQKFISNEVLLDHVQSIATKLFSKRYKSLWTDEEKADEVVSHIHLLLLQAHQAGILSPKAIDLVGYLIRLMERSDSHTIVQRPVCTQLAVTLCDIEAAKANDDSIVSTDEFYPTFEELSKKLSSVETDADEGLFCDEILEPVAGEMKQGRETKNAGAPVPADRSCTSVAEYVHKQKQHLREDFMISLRGSIQMLRETGSLDTLPQGTLFENVQIVLNKQFVNAQRHEMVFIDVVGSKSREGKRAKSTYRSALSELKTGALLCLTTSSAVENLILATVTYTDFELINEGYIGIEIGRQYNIGKIYDVDLLMFETPAFFEPYRNVYNFLSVCSITDFPMKEYIVCGKREVEKPSYLTATSEYSCTRYSFQPLDQPPPKELLLNTSQQAAFSAALRQEFCLILGPPGTGKTHLSIQLVKTLMDNATTPIVLVTYTNESLDKFLLQLSAYTDNIVRFGSQTRVREIARFNIRCMNNEPSQVNPCLNHLYYTTKSEFKAKFERLQTLIDEFDGSEESYQLIVDAQRMMRGAVQKLNTVSTIFSYYRVSKMGIVAMTTTCAAKMNFLFHLLKSSVVVFEEAAEILEPHAIACLTPYTQHVILIGDHQQLQPYTASRTYSRSVGLNISLFERLSQQLTPHLLTTQYRMRPAIAALIHPTIYAQLVNAEIVETYPVVRGMLKNVFFLTHDQIESRSKNDIHNRFEIQEITGLAAWLVLVGKYLATDIVILSPYAWQVKLISKELTKSENLGDIKVATVDSYQGLEANIVLLSLVRSNNTGQIGFLHESRRICVAISRAKHGLFMIGNMTLLSQRNRTWAAIQKVLLSQGALGMDFPYRPKEVSSFDASEASD